MTQVYNFRGVVQFLEGCKILVGLHGFYGGVKIFERIYGFFIFVHFHGIYFAGVFNLQQFFCFSFSIFSGWMRDRGDHDFWRLIWRDRWML
jgi:hypothetical protein